MIDEFWRQYNQSLFAYYYHQYEREFLGKCVRWISIGSYIITAVSVAGWGITQKYAVAWSVIIFLSQIANGLKDQFDISKRIWALELYLDNASSALNEIVKGWRLILLGRLTEDDILKRITTCSVCFNDLENRYIRPYSSGESVKIVEKAEKKTNDELKIRHGEGTINVESKLSYTNESESGECAGFTN